ncbi:MAG TPA: bifunctional serine/threonine-protein kinase/formylglycine-generating enzyme family protein [Myxococcota bacterium]|nr:bifunctional serine/threonine-protein kinase/formylglycine-generating enzyme family protein [Myxococcota bacterium]HRR74965.1 bifunctional serine/threonine-protein kinase/formylglycine-generating enzyme family protein [Myxococcota bacterium]HRV17243.1 bifunctional serine/threonine-protein kinase/formylglycine-generating enzyme family protein [Myxococcota bacterium]
MPEYCLHCCLEHRECTCDAGTRGRPVENPVFCLPAGTLLDGKYSIGRVLGAGGFGITYLAVDENRGLRVAIKEYMPRSDAVRSSDGVSILPGTVDDQDSFEFGLQKFVEEARVLARISEKDNPRIVSIHGFFKANGTAYLVMRYLEGQTLSGLLKSKGGSLPENEAIVILTAMLDGLREIHSAGLIHRDIKPQNVFITNDGGIKLIDFGAARYAQGAQSRGLTQVFTPPYAPSEQYSLRGDQGPWTDIYAVGVTFYQMLTARLPDDALSRLRDPTFVGPHAATGGKVSKALDGVIAKAMSPEVGDRYRSVDEFFEALSLPSSVKLNYQEPPKQPHQTIVEARKQGQERIDADKAAMVEPYRVKRDAEEDHQLIVKGLGDIHHTLRFVHIPAGTFMMGSSEGERPRFSDEAQHKVTLTRPFAMMVTPVTQSLWQFVMGNNPSYFMGPDLPVERVSWEDVQDFIQKLNKKLGIDSLRLPTEAEWEYACRAGTTGTRYGELHKIAWYNGNSDGKTHPVGTKAPNAWGLYDMLGNVWEWCQDWYGDYPSGSVAGPTGPSTGSGRVFRGGSWSNGTRYQRAAYRGSDSSGHRYHDLGFRLTRSVP